MITPPAEEILAALGLDRADLRQIQPPLRRSTYLASLNWLTRHQPSPGSSNFEQVKGLVEAAHLFCRVEAWAEAKQLLQLRLNTATREELDNQLH